jgi:hypothetical protein
MTENLVRYGCPYNAHLLTEIIQLHRNNASHACCLIGHLKRHKNRLERSWETSNTLHSPMGSMRIGTDPCGSTRNPSDS